MKIIEGDVSVFIESSNVEFEKVLHHFEKDILSLRTGKASVSLLDNVFVDVHGRRSKLKEIASILIPDARMIVISPWDKSLLTEISKGILASDLSINPVVDGNSIRLQLPQMSSERRDEMVKILHKKMEDAKVQLRNVRKDFHNNIKTNEKNKNISEDFSKKLEEKLQKNLDSWIEKIIAVAKKKETDLRHV